MTARFVVPSVAAVLLAALSATAQVVSEDVRTAGPAAVVPADSRPPVLWSMPLASIGNGPLITHPGGGPGGADASRVQNSTMGNTSLGFNASVTGGFRIADDVVIPAPGATLNTITFFTYQTGSTTTSTINVVRVQIWNGAPNAGGVVVFGDTTTNRFLSTAFSNIYRDSETSVGNNQRPIMTVTATVGTTLPAGTYWIDVQIGGTLASGPWVPPTTVLGQTSGCAGGCNALQWTGAAWASVSDAGNAAAQDIPFAVDYTLTPVTLQRIAVE